MEGLSLDMSLPDGSHPPHPESAELPARDRRAAEVPTVLRLEDVHEHVERRAVMKLEAADLERQRGNVPELGRPAPPVDPLPAAVEGRQRAPDPLDLPHSVQRPRIHATRLPRYARSKRPLPTDGGGARQGAPGRRRLAVRAEVGRLSG